MVWLVGSLPTEGLDVVQREKHPEDARCRLGCCKAVARGAAAGFALARAGSWGSALPGGLAGRVGLSPGQHGWPRGWGEQRGRGSGQGCGEHPPAPELPCLLSGCSPSALRRAALLLAGAVGPGNGEV